MLFEAFIEMLTSILRTPAERITFLRIGQYLIVIKRSNDEVFSRLAYGVSMGITRLRPPRTSSPVLQSSYHENYWAGMALPGGVKTKPGRIC